jgi:3-methylfumaryl-CoA hydratase
MAATFDYAAPPGEGEALPPGWHWIYFADTVRESGLSVDGHEERGDFLPPIDLPRRMWAGNRLLFHKPLRLGEKARRESEVVSIEQKQGRQGRLAFVTVHHRYSGDDGVAMEEWHDIVYRAPPSGDSAPPAPQPAPMAAKWRRELTPDEVMLFRYSAVTFNGHRIHYDYPYVTAAEGYDGLIVHGPLTATLLLDLIAREQPKATIREVRFRAMRPVYAGRRLTVEAAPSNGGIEAWALDADDAVAMRAAITLA